MAYAGAYVVVHVQDGVCTFAEPFDDIEKAEAHFEKLKADFNYNNDHLLMNDGYGLLMDSAGEEDDPLYEPE